MAPTMAQQQKQLKTAPDNAEENLLLVTQQLRSVIQTLYEASVAIHDYAGQSSMEHIASQINRLMSQYQEVGRSKDTLDVLIPRDIVQYVEDGRNPDIYTREFVEIVAKQNQFMNGKMRAFGEFRDVLAEQISSAFPELSEDVEMVLGKSAGRRRRRRRGEEKAVNGP